MMHPTAAMPLPLPGGAQRTGRTALACRLGGRTQYVFLRPAPSVFRSPRANLLEFAGAGFHYSVIGRVDVARRAAGSSWNAYRLPVVCGAVTPGAVAQGNDGRCLKPKHASSGCEPATGHFDAKGFRNARSMTVAGLDAKVS
jgi:hypothetical protein